MYTNRYLSKIILLGIILITIWGLSGCSSSPEAQATETPAPTQTALPPTPTPIPSAIKVNGEIVPQSLYDAWRASYGIAQESGSVLASNEEAQQTVVDELINQTLLAQGAAENGYTVSKDDLETRLASLTEIAGGEDKLAAWQQANGFDTENFREALQLAMAAAWQRDYIAANVPQEAEHVKARQLLLLDEDTANVYLNQLEAGVEFATLANIVDPTLGGDLYWFPRGYLTQVSVEEAAFALEPGQISEIIESDLGYHIIQVLDKGIRPLSPEARNFLQHQAVEDWLTERREQSQIEILLP